MNYDSYQPLIFSEWNFDNSLPVQDNLEISMDVYSPGGNTTLYWKIMANDDYAAYIIIQENYVFPAIVRVTNPVPIAMASLEGNEFNEIKLKFNYSEETITYYANGEEIHSDTMWGSKEEIDQYKFEAFLFEDMFIDNFQTNATLHINSPKDSYFTHFIQDDILIIEGKSRMESLEIYDVLGKKISSKVVTSTQTESNIGSLNSGVYIGLIKTQGKTQSFKFVKP